MTDSSSLVWPIIEITIGMLIFAGLAYAPLGYFIREYSKDKPQPFGETQPHGDSQSFVNDLAETAIHFIQSKLFAKK